MDGPPKIPVGRRGRGRAQPRLAEPDEHAPLNVKTLDRKRGAEDVQEPAINDIVEKKPAPKRPKADAVGSQMASLLTFLWSKRQDKRMKALLAAVNTGATKTRLGGEDALSAARAVAEGLLSYSKEAETKKEAKAGVAGRGRMLTVHGITVPGEGKHPLLHFLLSLIQAAKTLASTPPVAMPAAARKPSGKKAPAAETAPKPKQQAPAEADGEALPGAKGGDNPAIVVINNGKEEEEDFAIGPHGDYGILGDYMGGLVTGAAEQEDGDQHANLVLEDGKAESVDENFDPSSTLEAWLGDNFTKDRGLEDRGS